MRQPKPIDVADYRPLVDDEVIDRVREKVKPPRGIRIAHINSTYYGGGVGTLLSSLTLLLDSVGIKTGWRVLQGSPDFFSITEKCTTPCRAARST